MHNKAVKGFTQQCVHILEKMNKTRCWSCQRNLISKKNWLTELLTGRDEASEMRITESVMYTPRELLVVLWGKEIYIMNL